MGEGKLSEESAIAYLERAPLHHVDMLECLRRGSAEVLESGGRGVLLLERESGAHMLSADDEETAERMLAEVERTELLVLHQEFGAAFAEERFGLHDRLTVYNAAYLSREPLPAFESPAEIRRMDESFLPFLAEHYTRIPDRDYLLGRLRAGVMFGAFVGGEPAGFIGMHEEGSIGLLEVLPEFRRRGIARMLGGHMVNRLLERGRVPFAQIAPDNFASLELNRGLGLTFSRDTIRWLMRRA